MCTILRGSKSTYFLSVLYARLTPEMVLPMGDAEVRSDDQRRVYGLAINYLGRALKLYGIARARIQIAPLVQMNLTKRMKKWEMKEFGLTLGTYLDG